MPRDVQRRQNLYCNKCAHISNVGYSFLSSSKAENVLWFCTICKAPARIVVLEDKCIGDNYKEYIDKLHQ